MMEFRERKRKSKPAGNPFDDDDGFDKPFDDEEIQRRRKSIEDIVDDVVKKSDKEQDKVTKRKEKSGE